MSSVFSKLEKSGVMIKRVLMLLAMFSVASLIFAGQGIRISPDDIPPYLKALQVKAETIGPYYMQSSSAGDAVLGWVQNIFQEQGYDENIIFQELCEATGNHLVLLSSCITFRMPAVFDYINTPTFPVTWAMRASMAIPLFFAPSQNLFGGKNAYFVDGGVANNYPIWYFDNDSSAKTLGFILSPESAFNSSDYIYYDISNVMDDIEGTFSIMLNNEATVMLQGNQYRTIFIDPGSVGTLSFTLSEEQKNEIIETAYTATQEYFEGSSSSDSNSTSTDSL